MKQFKYKGLVLLAAILWGTTGTSQGLAPEGASSLSIGAMRMLVGGIIMLLLAFKFDGRIKIKKDHIPAIVLAGACIGLYQPLFFASVKMTGVAFGTIMAIGSAPVFTAVIEVIKGRKPTTVWMLSTIMALVGCYMLFSGQVDMSINIMGVLFALGAGLAYAVYVQASKNVFDILPRLTANGLIFAASGLLLSPILFFSNISWVISGNGALVVLHLGGIATALAYTLFAFGLKGVSSPTAVTLTLGEPFTAAMLGILIFGETLTILSITGIAVLFSGLLIAALPIGDGQETLEICD